MEPILILGIAIVVLLLLALLGVMLWIWGQTNARIAAIDQQITQSVEQQRSTTESFAQIQQGLGQLSEASRHMEQVGKEIASLGDLLRAPKLRGGIGELFLGDLLAQMLSPEHYELQYTFRSGERVDAVVRLAAGMVPVDSKFPLESFQRMISLEDEAARAQARKEFLRVVKKHIDAIADKYIRPDEGTFDFALMYIPAENVYYETILREEELGEEKGLLEHALQKHVIPVSPNSFYAYLQAIALGLRGMQIEQQAKEILGYLGRLEGDFRRLQQTFG
ncbi:MAG TPA: DNA recombination protein RmuC, partial [Chloroflexi bacterium]|nr:DNA recombination protein RmuC [Chloroflexota bacterium]